MKLKVLIVEDVKMERDDLHEQVEQCGHDPIDACTGEEALRLLQTDQEIDVLITDWLLGPPGTMDGLELIRQCRDMKQRKSIHTIFLTSQTSDAAAALEAGADDFMTKPVYEAILRKRLDIAAAQLQSEALEDLRGGYRPDPDLVTGGIRDIMDKVEKCARTRQPVLITGETGTGKEHLARAIHYFGDSLPRRPFIVINCSNIEKDLAASQLFGHIKNAFTGAGEMKRGLFELAHGGTLFLDEIGDLDLPLQAKLLRVLEDKSFDRLGAEGKPIKVDVRVIAATNKDLLKAIREGKFRLDLFQRFVLHIQTRPLRDRREDIPKLVELFLERVCREEKRPCCSITPTGMERLKDYKWPGNIRELLNVITQAVVWSDGTEIKDNDLELGEVNKDRDAEDIQANEVTLEDLEDGFIAGLIVREAKNGNLADAARNLKINENTLRYRAGKLTKRNILVKNEKGHFVLTPKGEMYFQASIHRLRDIGNCGC